MRIAIQGELGSNSHMAAREVAADAEIVPCMLSAEVFERLDAGSVESAVLPIENTLHGSVSEHYDLLLAHTARVTGETMLRVRHNVLARPGVRLSEVRRILSHPVALSQCRHWLRMHPGIEAVPYYDTAGSVKHLMLAGQRDTAGIAPALAGQVYGAEILLEGIEDHAENHTRFYTLERPRTAHQPSAAANKLTVAFSLEHKPGTLLGALEAFQASGLNLTKIESRPVPGKPWEYVFFADIRFSDAERLDLALSSLAKRSVMVQELGRYRAAV